MHLYGFGALCVSSCLFRFLSVVYVRPHVPHFHGDSNEDAWNKKENVYHGTPHYIMHRHTLDRHTLDRQTLDRHTLDRQTLDCQTLDHNTLDRHTFDCIKLSTAHLNGH